MRYCVVFLVLSMGFSLNTLGAPKGALRLKAEPKQAVDTAQDALSTLVGHLGAIKDFDGQFEQWIMDDSGRRVQEIQGQLRAKRPHAFSWQTFEPFPQLIISDGRRLWVYDEDLAQVTVKPLLFNLGDTPALLLSGDLDQIDQAFHVQMAHMTKTSSEFKLLPKTQDHGFEHLALVFESGELTHLQMLDALGQRTLIEFSDVRVNSGLKSSLFEFEVPDGVDLIDETQG